MYCERKNNGKKCKDYKYRLCCSKEDKKVYGSWGSWGKCQGDCGQDNAFQTRTRKCFENRPNCRKINGKMVVEDKEPCTIKCKSKDFSPPQFSSSILFFHHFIQRIVSGLNGDNGLPARQLAAVARDIVKDSAWRATLKVKNVLRAKKCKKKFVRRPNVTVLYLFANHTPLSSRHLAVESQYHTK